VIGRRRQASRGGRPAEKQPGRSAQARPVGREVGRRIAALRHEKRLTLEALAAGTGLNVSFLSKLERGQTSISVDNLRDVAHFLGVEMVHFFRGPEKSSAVVTRKGKGTPLQIANTDAVGESLIATMSGSLQATLYSTPKGQGRADGFSHPGDELVYVLRGRICYFVGSQEYILNGGDSIWHRSAEPHGWRTVGTTTALTLHVNTPPIW
jgi:transcriptional regulator with XRE-family HTH domain